MSEFRIINERLESVSVEDIQPHPRNPRVGKTTVIRRSIEVNGFYGAVIVQKTTGHILAGNHRYKAALQAGAQEVPVMYVDVDDTEALRIMLADNRTSDVGTYNEDALFETMKEIGGRLGLDGTGYTGLDFDKIEMWLAENQGTDEDVHELEDEHDAEYEMWHDMIEDDMPSDTAPYGITDLRLDMMATTIPMPLHVWRDKSRFAQCGTMVFYADDYKIEELWTAPYHLQDCGCDVAVEVDFTTETEMPLARQIWQIYRRRWVARFWQNLGIKIIVDINTDFGVGPELALAGVPEGWKSYCTRVHRQDKGDVKSIMPHFEWATERAGGDILFAVYGGGVDIRRECSQRGWWWIPEKMARGSGSATDADFIIGTDAEI